MGEEKAVVVGGADKGAAFINCVLLSLLDLEADGGGPPCDDGLQSNEGRVVAGRVGG